MKIPIEIDELMWGIAESGDRNATRQFEERYPKYKEQLQKRLTTVQALKASGKVIPERVLPAFKPQTVAPFQPKPFYFAAGFGAVCLALAGIWSTTRPSAEVQKQIPIVVQTNDQNAPPTVAIKENLPQPAVVTQPPAVANEIPTEPIEVQDPITPKTSLNLANASLHTAIKLIGAAGKLNVTIAPGTPNPEINIDFVDITPMEMLKQLGEEYAFTAVIDGDRDILILPVREDENESKSPNSPTTN
jgi:hypothetical protein